MTTNIEQPTSPAVVLSVLDSHPVADIGPETLIRLAAAHAPGSEDPVDQALVRAVGKTDIPMGQVEDFDPAVPDRKYSLAAVRGARVLGENQDVAVMRGDVDSVIAASAHGREERRLVQKGVSAMSRLGHRCMAVAVAPLDGNRTGEFELKGFIVFGVGNHPRAVNRTRGGYTRVEMWPLALRIQHWLNMLLIITMSVTGYYIMNPFFGPDASEDTGYLMGNIRFIHFVAAFAWIVLALWRLGITVFARQRQMRWRSLWPIYNMKNFKDTMGTAAYYLFLRKEEPVHVGHNGLQQITYTGIYGLCIIQILTGLALYGLPHQDVWFWRFISMPVVWFGIPIIRLIHAMIMFLIMTFVVLHVYLAFRADALEKHGGVSAMINGGVWLPTGARPVDGPEIE